MSFKEPLPASQGRERSLANGADKILFFAAAISADSIHSQYDVPELLPRPSSPKASPTVNLGAWNDHELTLNAIAEKVRAAAASLPDAQASATTETAAPTSQP